MTVKELQTILADYHPDEEVGLRSGSHRNMTFLGVYREKTREYGHLVLTVDFTINDKPVESVRDRLERQEAMIRGAIERIDKEELMEARKKMMKTPKKNRTEAQSLVDGYIRSGARGRPVKVKTEEEIREEVKPKKKMGRPRKIPKKPVVPVDVFNGISQETNQLLEIFNSQ